ncbi:MAG: hypothetical protein MUE60_14110, partial [Candidatus Eisenbacteria bacterium]|nr:hypothetical protein [Candidatus Eisenbacteria bacterium]
MVRAELAISAAILLGSGFLLLISPRLFGYWLMEDLPPEWFEFFCLALGAGLWGKATAARWRSRAWLGLLLCAGMAALCAFVAGEEISWGQRIVGYQTPTYFSERNVQHEVTIHNLARQLVEPRRLAMLIMVVYGILVPVLAWLVKPLKLLANRLGVPVPNLGAVVCSGLAVWLMNQPFTATDDEVGEVFFCLGLLFAGFTATGLTSGRTLLRAVAGLGAVSLAVSGLCFVRPAHRHQVFNVGHLKAAQAFEGRGMRWEAAREYEDLARHWKTDWELWIRVIGMYYEEGDLAKAFDLSAEFIQTTRREWRPFEVIAEIGLTKGMQAGARRLLRAVLVDEPYNDYARWA